MYFSDQLSPRRLPEKGDIETKAASAQDASTFAEQLRREGYRVDETTGVMSTREFVLRPRSGSARLG